MILFFYGPNDYLLKQKLKELKDKYKLSSPGSFDLLVLEGDSLNFEKFAAQTQTVALFATTRLIIINQVFDAPKETLDKIKEYLPQISSGSVVVFVHVGTPDKRLGLFKALNQPKISQHFEKIDDRSLVPFVEKIAKSLEAKFAAGAQEYLVQQVGNDLWQLASETEKLSTYRNKQTIEKSDIDRMVTANVSANAFALTDAIVAKNKAKAFMELEALFLLGEDPFKIMGAINYQFRILAQTKDESERGGTGYEIATRLKVRPFQIQKALPIAKALNWSDFQRIYHYLVKLDEDSKTGKILAEEGLKDLLINLTC
jgi:DNA polymerase-3 subunit delta